MNCFYLLLLFSRLVMLRLDSCNLSVGFEQDSVWAVLSVSSTRMSFKIE